MTAVSVRRITDESVVARKPSSTNSETVSLGTMGDGDSLRLRLSTTNPSRSYPATDRPARTAPSGRGTSSPRQASVAARSPPLAPVSTMQRMQSRRTGVSAGCALQE